MKMGYYIGPEQGTSGGSIGVDLKIKNQCDVLKGYFQLELLCIYKKKTNIIKSILWRMPFGSYGMKYEEVLKCIDKTDFLYIRKRATDKAFLNFFKQLRRRCTNGKIILEIPTYPYKRELLFNKEMWPFYFKDIFYCRFLNRYVDKIVTFSNDEFIFGIPTIRTQNGIVVDRVTPIQNMELDDTIDLLAVAQFQKAHGYERILKGLWRFYQQGGKRSILLHLVGDGNESMYYKKLVVKYGLEDKVIFYGNKKGTELDEIYEKMDIGLGSFGSYKKGIHISSSLKVREYLSKGLPIISGCREDVLDDRTVDFYLQFNNDSSEIDISKIVAFYDNIYLTGQSRGNVVSRIRKYAYENVDMKIVLKPVIEYINC